MARHFRLLASDKKQFDLRTKKGREQLILSEIKARGGIYADALDCFPGMQNAFSRLQKDGVIEETGKWHTFPWLQCKIIKEPDHDR